MRGVEDDDPIGASIGIEVRTLGPLWVPMKPNFKSNFNFSGRFFKLFGRLDMFFGAESRAEYVKNKRF